MAAIGQTAAGATRSAPGAGAQAGFGTPPYTASAPFGRVPVSGAPFVPAISNDTDLARALDQYIAAVSPSSPLRGKGAAFVRAARQNGLDPSELVAIAQVESELGTAGAATTGGHNAFGLGAFGSTPNGIRYPTWEAGIAAAAKTIAGYHATDLAGVMRHWNPQNATAEATAVGNVWSHLPRPPGVVAPVTPHDTSPGGQPIDTGVGPQIVNAITSPLDAIKAALSFLIDTHNWLRLGESLMGGLLLVGAIWSLLKGRSGLALVLGIGGYVFLYGGVKDVRPIDEVKAAFGG